MAAGHYFDPVPRVRSSPGTVTLVLPDGRVDLRVDRGVFSAGRVDPGTVALLRAASPPVAATGDHLLDLGCGYGAIACTLARRAPAATVWAVDVNERARDLAAANAEVLGLGNVRTVAPESVPGDVRFAAVWSNPPIRIGKEALHDLLAGWLARLADEGEAWLVVQRHLGADSLAAWLATAGWPVDRHASKQGYRILHLRAPRAADRPSAP
ncbi:MAG TPA: methyltransferase [Acidimicrobiales bacterium]|nr:methyltransferase [Acidimicrobiales bacterium]